MGTSRRTSTKKFVLLQLFLVFCKFIYGKTFHFIRERFLLEKNTQKIMQTQKFVDYIQFFFRICKIFLRKSIKCGIKCKKFHKEILMRSKVIQLLIYLIRMVFDPHLLQMAEIIKTPCIDVTYHYPRDLLQDLRHPVFFPFFVKLNFKKLTFFKKKTVTFLQRLQLIEYNLQNGRN